MVNYQLTINGIVQGVGFRWGCMSIARQLKVTGFVRNLPSGRVYIEVQGSKDQVQQFIEQVKAGPTPYARVVDCQVATGRCQDYDQVFTIRR
ncbi:acylphosphatase [Limosilactobacillus panis]|uniref:acylphosphatase n=1 Tax=Limosilactobacillus panis TaxID=47493 RepID=UPI001C95F041|nr:acylphosphatase [Limosilactobacillus panis]QZN92493.1 acylphosphatase [Limosilactobacillus panis]